MIEERYKLRVLDVPVDVVRKRVENLHLSVHPPTGRVRVAAPAEMSREAVRLAVIDRLGWIKRQRRDFARQARQPRREYVGGETHLVWGRRFRLRVMESENRPRVSAAGGVMTLRVGPGADRDARERLVRRWYRDQLEPRAGALIAELAPAVGQWPADWRVRRMKTKWGSCKRETRRVWLNLELAKKPPECLRYVIAHELAHLVERHHTDRFRAILDRCVPGWRGARARLDAEPLAHEEWPQAA